MIFELPLFPKLYGYRLSYGFPAPTPAALSLLLLAFPKVALPDVVNDFCPLSVRCGDAGVYANCRCIFFHLLCLILLAQFKH